MRLSYGATFLDGWTEYDSLEALTVQIARGVAVDDDTVPTLCDLDTGNRVALTGLDVAALRLLETFATGRREPYEGEARRLLGAFAGGDVPYAELPRRVAIERGGRRLYAGKGAALDRCIATGWRVVGQPQNERKPAMDQATFFSLISARSPDRVPEDDARDFRNGATRIPGKVTDARRRGETVAYDPARRTWRLPSGATVS